MVVLVVVTLCIALTRFISLEGIITAARPPQHSHRRPDQQTIAYRTAVHQAVAGNHAVGWNLDILHAEVHAAMRDEHVQFPKRSRIEEQIQRLGLAQENRVVLDPAIVVQADIDIPVRRLDPEGQR